MKLAYISDIHSNLEALRKVLADILKEGADAVLCLGDMVGYFAHPSECLELLRNFSKPVHLIRGNHELFLRDQDWQEDCQNALVLPGIRQADKELSDEQYNFLQSLPRSLEFPDWGVIISHDTLTWPGNGQYVSFLGENYGEEPCYSQLKFLPETIRVGFLGHTHVPYFYEKEGTALRANFHEYSTETDYQTQLILPEAQYIINPGSVGQPRDYDNRAAYGILQLCDVVPAYTLKRIPYDVNVTIKAIDNMSIENEEIAERLKNRLSRGW